MFHKSHNSSVNHSQNTQAHSVRKQFTKDDCATVSNKVNLTLERKMLNLSQKINDGNTKN